MYQCNFLRLTTTVNWYRVSFTAAYWIIIVRDATTMLITCYFCFRVIRQQRMVARLTGEDNDPTNALLDFDMLLMSVLPHKYFIKFLQEQHSRKMPYLQMIHLCKLYQDDLQNLAQLKVMLEQEMMNDNIEETEETSSKLNSSSSVLSALTRNNTPHLSTYRKRINKINRTMSSLKHRIAAR
jgi:hypothetical protein